MNLPLTVPILISEPSTLRAYDAKKVVALRGASNQPETLCSAASLFRSHGGQRRDEILIETKEVLDAVTVAGEWSRSIKFVHGFVELLMRLSQLMRYDVNVMKIGEI